MDSVKCPHCPERFKPHGLYDHISHIFDYKKHGCLNCSYRTSFKNQLEFHKNITSHQVQENLEPQSVMEDILSYIVWRLFEKNTGQKSFDALTSFYYQLPKMNHLINSISSFESQVLERVNSIKFNNFTLRFLRIPFYNNFLYEKQYGANPTSEFAVMVSNIIYRYALPTMDSKKPIQCSICSTSLNGNYLSRRSHAVLNHGDLVLRALETRGDFKFDDYVFEVFKIIKKAFKDNLICSDFQCLSCGSFQKNKNEMCCHIASVHLKTEIKCPLLDCAFIGMTINDFLNHLKKEHNIQNVKDWEEISRNISFQKASAQLHEINSVSTTLLEKFLSVDISYYLDKEDEIRFYKKLNEFKTEFLESPFRDRTNVFSTFNSMIMGVRAIPIFPQTPESRKRSFSTLEGTSQVEGSETPAKISAISLPTESDLDTQLKDFLKKALQ
uniref:C2H2-type domain-containing protein n=1 Tax=Parastrongyloides trichosuri TaxID=131310 RepID=A0A0N4ZME7_PARTI